MSRALARRSEFAVRAAIGASVDRLVRQMLTDSFVLAACGGVLGICPRGRGGAAARAPGSNQSADRRGAAHRPADARRHVAAHRRRRHGVWPVACASRLPQDRRLRAQGWRPRRHEPRHRETSVRSGRRRNRGLGGVDRHRRIADPGAPERAARRPGIRSGQRADGTDNVAADQVCQGGAARAVLPARAERREGVAGRGKRRLHQLPADGHGRWRMAGAVDGAGPRKPAKVCAA